MLFYVVTWTILHTPSFSKDKAREFDIQDVVNVKIWVKESYNSTDKLEGIPFKSIQVSDNTLYLVGGLNPSEKYERQLGWLFQIYGKTKNVPNHQPLDPIKPPFSYGFPMVFLWFSHKNFMA